MPTPPYFPPVTPPPAPPILRGMQLSLTTHSAGTVESGEAIPFNSIVANNTVGLSYAPTSGEVTFNCTGTYLVNWWVAIDNAQPQEVAFSLQLNGNEVQTSYSDIGGGQIYGTAILPVSAIGSELSLVNASGGTITYATTKGQAGMTVTQVK